MPLRFRRKSRNQEARTRRKRTYKSQGVAAVEDDDSETRTVVDDGGLGSQLCVAGAALHNFTIKVGTKVPRRTLT